MTMGKIKTWWSAWKQKRAEEYHKRVTRHRMQEAKRDIQPLVWNGKVWLAYCGTPILEADALKGDLLKGVEQAQMNVAEYMISEGGVR